MTKQDKVRAFALRCDGMTWEQISAVMHYTGRHIARSLHLVMQGRPKQITEHQGGPTNA